MRNFDGRTLNPGRKVAMAQLDTKESRLPFLSPVCSFCKHWQTNLLRGCAAFPVVNAIPDEIWRGKNRHTEAYPGDHGVHFERRAK